MFKTSEECDVVLISSGGDDWMPVTAARVSFGRDLTTKRDEARDKKLMKYLADHKHMSCFEHQTATFMIECPLFVRSHIHRHRTMAFNEISRRYTEENLEFWIPTTFRGQASDNKQASEGELNPLGFTEFLGWNKDEQGIPQLAFPSSSGSNAYTMWEYAVHHARLRYLELLENGVSREQARSLLPQSLLTRFYATANLRNWAHFLELRLDDHTQRETQIVAEKVSRQLHELWPNSMEAIGL